MKGVTSILAVLGLAAFAAATVDYSDCSMEEGWYGEYTDCPEGHIGVGACGSGAKADCSGQYHTFDCCRLAEMKGYQEPAEDANTQMSCHTEQGNYGERVECSANEGLVTLCTSGLHPSCGEVTSIVCCDTPGIQTDSCMWRAGDWGDHIDCGEGWIMQGYCGSGDRYDCNGESHEVKCCELIE